MPREDTAPHSMEPPTPGQSSAGGSYFERTPPNRGKQARGENPGVGTCGKVVPGSPRGKRHIMFSMHVASCIINRLLKKNKYTVTNKYHTHSL